MALIALGSSRPSGSEGGGSTGEPNPPRAQSTTLSSVIWPQMSPGLAGGGRSAAALDQPDERSAGACGPSHTDAPSGMSEASCVGPQPSVLGTASATGRRSPHSNPWLGAGAAGPAMSCPAAGASAARAACDGVHFRAAAGRSWGSPQSSSPPALAAGEGLSLQPFQSLEESLDPGETSSDAASLPLSSAATSKSPIMIRSPCSILCSPWSRSAVSFTNVPLVLVSVSQYAPSRNLISQWRDEMCRCGSGRLQSQVDPRPIVAPRS